MTSLTKICIIGILFLGISSSLLSFHIFDFANFYRLKDNEEQSYKFYIINQEKASDLLNSYEIENNEESFSIVNFIEKLNGDFKLDY